MSAAFVARKNGAGGPPRDQNGVGCAGSRREIEPDAFHAILDLDNPKIGIERDFPLQPLLGGAGIDGRLFMRAGEKPSTPGSASAATDCGAGS